MKEAQHVLEYLDQTNQKKKMKAIFRLAFEQTLKILEKSKDSFSVSLTLVSKEEIQSLNKTYRDTDRPTDVLTFAFLEADVFNPNDVTDLGNIIICPQVALEQCGKYSHPVEREMAFLFIHGLLHAFGYDHHGSQQQAEEMFALQNRILNTMPYDFYADEGKMKKLLLKAQSMSYSPYSHFRVGAVCMTKDKKFHIGFNIENSAYGDSMCAERVCLFSTYAQGYKKEDIVSFALITDSSNIGSPCGSCRQVMSELMNLNTIVHIYNKDMTKKLDTHVEELLPFVFTSEDLNA